MAGTRDRLLDASLRAFATKGVEGTPITELEEAAGLAAGSGGFYRYYRTKDEALAAAVQREVDRLADRRDARPPVAAAESPHEGLTSAVHEWLDTLASIRRLIAVLARERDRIPDLAREISTHLVEAWVRHDDAVAAAIAARDRDVDTDALGAVMISSVVGYHLATEYFGGPPAGVDSDRFVAAMVDLYLPA